MFSRQRPIDLAKSQEMRSALSQVNVIIINKASKQKGTGGLHEDGCISVSSDLHQKESGIVVESTGSCMKTGNCKYFGSPTGCIRRGPCFYKHMEEDIRNSKFRMRLENFDMDDCKQKIFDDRSVFAAVDSHYVTIWGEQVEIQSFLSNHSISQENHRIQPQKQDDQEEQSPFQPQSASIDDKSTCHNRPEQMSWADRLVKGPPSCNKEPESQVFSTSLDHKMPAWYITLKKWLPEFLRKVSNNAREGEFYALSSLKADFRSTFGLELDHASLGYCKLSDFMKSLPGLCHIRVVPVGGIGAANHMVLMPIISRPPPLVIPSRDDHALSAVVLSPLDAPSREDHSPSSLPPFQDQGDSDSDDHKLSLQDLLPPSCEDIGLIQSDSEDNCCNKVSQKNESLGNNMTAVNLRFLQFLKPDTIFHGRTWLWNGGFKDLNEPYRPRHLVLEALAQKRKEVFFLRTFDFYDDYKASVERRSCFACDKSMMLWANYPCQHLLWCGDCKFIAMRVAAVGTCSHKCVVCDSVVEHINLLPWTKTDQQIIFDEIHRETSFPPIDATHLRR
ncbi:hypothetical protein Nepgr_017502 [Nepenthes gracilis]|uniref:HTH OST-type domain-containing protein n=1 Tax=Nepenthes gracilis TaxID=150966 RepID=A0AAD3XTF0_NEPGR|nr:hypothetical protein Nepgr_017502 [Nepenthes gracilis]